MRVIVFGYGTVCCAGLTELLRQGHEVAAVVTQEDNPEDRGWFESVVQYAAGARLRAFTPEDPNEPAFVQELASLQPDLILSLYYRQMLKAPLLALPPEGALNMHGSYLPEYRGRCPINWAVLEGRTETGVTLHYMVEAPDAGDIVLQRRLPIPFEATWYDLYGQVAGLAGELLREALPLLAAGTAPRVPQDLSKGFYRGGRKPADGRFQWEWPARRIYDLARAVTHPYPGAFADTVFGPLLVWECLPEEASDPEAPPGTLTICSDDGPAIATGDGDLLLTRVQIGEQEMSGVEFLATYEPLVGDSICPRA